MCSAREGLRTGGPGDYRALVVSPSSDDFTTGRPRSAAVQRLCTCMRYSWCTDKGVESRKDAFLFNGI